MRLGPLTFAITSLFRSNARYHCSRRVRKEFAELARTRREITWMLGRYPGVARLRTEVDGIAVASRIEIGRVVFRESSIRESIQGAFELLRMAEESRLTSGILDRLLVRFTRADQRPDIRAMIRDAYLSVFAEQECTFLAHERDLIEIGHCSVFQTVTQFIRQDGLYHSGHRAAIEAVRRHLQKEVGRYENYRFAVKPRAVLGGIPSLEFYYTGAQPNRRVEIYLAEYAQVKPIFVPAREFEAHREQFIDLDDYERGSRRFGGLWVLQEDVVRSLTPPQVSLLCLFFNHKMHPDLDRSFSWSELASRQEASPHISRSARRSEAFLETNLEELVNRQFVREANRQFRLHPRFAEFKQVAFYVPGEFRSRSKG